MKNINMTKQNNSDGVSSGYDYNNSLIAFGKSINIASIAFISVACLFCCSFVAMRSYNIGTDTQAYANFFLDIDKYGFADTRLEPGYVLFAHIVSSLGFSIIGMQAITFLLLIITVIFSVREYWKYLGSMDSNLMFLVLSLSLFFVSPMFVNASINAIRQGLASLLIFTALLSFYRHSWFKYLVFAILSTGFHYSSVIYLVLAPILFLDQRKIQIIAILAFVFYCSGLSEVIIKTYFQFIYAQVMDYKYGSDYNAGARIDFAIFSVFWYVVPYIVTPLIRKGARDKIMATSSVYLVMLLPFFMIGFGNYSNRLLVPAWLSTSLLVAALIYNCRIILFRHPVYMWMGLCVSIIVFYYLMSNELII